MKAAFVMLVILITGSSIAQDQMYDVCPLKVGAEVPSDLSFVNADCK